MQTYLSIDNEIDTWCAIALALLIKHLLVFYVYYLTLTDQPFYQGCAVHLAEYGVFQVHFRN